MRHGSSVCCNDDDDDGRLATLYRRLDTSCDKRDLKVKNNNTNYKIIQVKSMADQKQTDPSRQGCESSVSPYSVRAENEPRIGCTDKSMHAYYVCNSKLENNQ
jgi:hypothetical protein